MSYSNAISRLPFGGGAAVLRQPAGDFDRRALFKAFGSAVDRLEGRFIATAGTGTSASDIAWASTWSRKNTIAVRQSVAASSFWTAFGALEGMKACVEFLYGSSLAGFKVIVLGVAHVGAELCRMLAKAEANVVIADLDRSRARSIARETGGQVVDVTEIGKVDAQVFAPCSPGIAFDSAFVHGVRARIVCGAGNEQPVSYEVADQMKARGLVYAPDYVVNVGGIISLAAGCLGESEDQVRRRVMAIGPLVREILDLSENEGCSSTAAADKLAETIMKNVDVTGATFPAPVEMDEAPL